MTPATHWPALAWQPDGCGGHTAPLIRHRLLTITITAYHTLTSGVWVVTLSGPCHVEYRGTLADTIGRAQSDVRSLIQALAATGVV